MSGSNDHLSSAVGGGLWTSANTTIATVGSATGIVTGASAGTTTISYSVTNGCGTAVALRAITVNPLPDAGVISGSTSLCKGATTTLSNTVSGGTWISGSPSVATIGSVSGVVSGIAAGTAVLFYTVANSCGTATVTTVGTVNPLPDAGTITGTGTVCTGAVRTLSNAATGGEWSSAIPL